MVINILNASAKNKSNNKKKFSSKKGLKTEGIFRISGVTTVIQKLKQEIAKGNKRTFAFPEDDCHTVAGILKLWLREMPEPLLTFELYGKIMRIYLLNAIIGCDSSFFFFLCNIFFDF